MGTKPSAAEQSFDAAARTVKIQDLSQNGHICETRELVEHAAEEIESILRRHIGAPPGPPGAKGKLALERLLDELEAAPETAANAH